MTRKKWRDIKAAAELLGLGERASLAEIKKAYRRLSKKHHPDMQGNDKQAEKVLMHELTEAYQKLLHYCTEYRIPLIPGEDEQLDAEDWWFERFGQDHLWGRGNMEQEDPEK